MIYALVTVYSPNNFQEVLKNIMVISSQVDKLFVLDNSPTDEFKNRINQNDNIEYIFFNENKGISKAFNFVLKRDSFFKEDDYVIFFDQDSSIYENHISILVNDYSNLLEQHVKVGCLGPIFYNTSSGKIENSFSLDEDSKTMEVKKIITSSMLCKYGFLRSIGFFNENVFLDLADWDCCWRFINHGYKCFLTKSSVLYHSIGCGEKKVLFIKLKVGNPIREYYQTRDCLYLLKEKYVPIKEKIRFILMLTIRPILHILFLDNKKLRCKYIKQGVRDYFLKKQGSINR